MTHRQCTSPVFRTPAIVCAGLLLLGLSGTAVADEGPAVDTSAGSVRQEAPAVATTPPPAGGARTAPGTTIYGDDENPIGLYIIPWRASSPTPQMDRPARFVDETEAAVDETQFTRFVEYYDALTRHRQAQMDSQGRP